MKDALRHKLETFIRKYYQNRLIKGVIYGVGLALGHFFVLALAEYFGHFSSDTRFVLLIFLLTGLAGILSYYILYPISKLLRLGRRLSYDKAARLIGKHFPEVDDKILNTLQLQAISRSESDLLGASIDQRIADLSPVPFGSAIDFGENKRYWPILVVPVLVFAGVFITGNWDLVSESGRRIAAYNQEFLPKAPFELVLKNESLSVEQGEDITLELSFKGKSLPADAVLVLPFGESRMVKGESGNFRFTLNNLQEGVDFRFKAAGFLSKKFNLDVLPVPQVSAFTLQVSPPSYTGIQPFETEAKLVQDIPEGSTVNWLLNLRQADQAFLQTSGSEFPFERTGTGRYSFTKVVKENFDYSVKTTNKVLSKTNISGNQIKIIKDEFPEIKVDFSSDTANSNLVYYSGTIRDDYGFSGFRLVVQSRESKVSKPLTLSRDGITQSFGAVIVLDSLAGERSDDVKVYLEISDNDGVNGAKTSRSEEFRFKVLGKDDKRKEVSKNYDQFFKQSEQTQKELEEIQNALERLRKQMMDKKAMSYQDKARLKDLLKKQKELLEKQRENEELMEQVKKKEERLDKKPEEIKKEEEEIGKLKSEKDKETEELLKEIEKLMEKLDTEKLMERLEELRKMNEQNQKAMYREDDLIKDLKFRKDLLQQAEKLERLSEEMKELSEKEDPKGEKGTEERSESKKQEKVEKELDEVKEKIEEMKEENQAFKKESEEQEVGKKGEQASDEMQKSQQNLQKNQQQKANESQKKAGEKMNEMSESLQMSMAQMQAKANQVNIETLRQILENLETLSFDVEDLSDKSKEIKKEDPSFKKLLTEQRRLKDGAKVIEDSLTALAKKVPQIQQQVFEELDLVKSNLDRSINDLEELRSAQAAGHQQYVMTSANNLALMLETSLRQMQQMAAQAKPGSQQCEKPGNKPGSKPGMSQMRQMQQGLGEKMGRMQGGKKGEGEDKGKRGMSGKEIVEIISQQEQLRQTLEELSEQQGNTGSKGNMQKAIEEMKELERDLVDGNLDSDYKKRLKVIETRLLESERAELQQKKEERRESETADELQQLYDRELEKYLKEKGFENESLDRLPLDFRNYYKGQTSKYLNSL